METAIKSEQVLRYTGIRLLIDGMGVLNAERFINCIMKDNFNYTEWQKDLWKDKTIEEIHEAASAFYFNNNK